MEYEFSTMLEGVNCHIRAFCNQVVPDERVHQRPHKHFFMEFHCVFSGEEQVVLPLRKATIPMKPGQILMIPREVYHGVYTGEGSVERLCFSFSAEGSQTHDSPVLECFQNIKDVQVFEDPNAVALIRRYCNLKQDSPLADVLQGSLLLNAVLELFSGIPGKWQQVKNAGTRELRQKWIIEDYIATAFTSPEGLDGLAKRLFLSQRQTRTLVRRFLGEDYKTLVIRRRMELADIFLEDPEKSLEDIAREVGYSSYSGFNLAFKQHFGITPRERRKVLLDPEK